MATNTVAVLGGGTGGLAAARRLRRKLEPADRVVLIERDLEYRFAPSFLWVMAGLRRPAQITADLGGLRRHGIEVVETEVKGIEPEARVVNTGNGEIGYDRLLVALGAQLAPDLLPGFAETAHNVYTLEGSASACEALRDFDGGRVIVVVSSQPYKCPAAPYEAAFLAETVLRRRGVLDRSSIDIYTPDPFPMATAGPMLGDALTAMLNERGIGAHFGESPTLIDTEDRALVLASGERVSFDLLLGVPPHVAPVALAGTGLIAPSGFVSVDPETLETGAEGVYAVGDATTIPIAGDKTLPKAGVFAHAQGDIVADRIVAELKGQTPTSTFNGKGSCFVEMGMGRAAFATGDFYAETAPEISLRRPGRHWHLAKVALEKSWMRRWVS
jgi:sulfide:quinone oxidoreductase